MEKYTPRKTYDQPYKPLPDNGNLHATQIKKKAESPDYFGEIYVNLKDMTSIRIEDGLHVIRISGWKKISPSSGKTYLSLAVNRFVPEEQAQAMKQAAQPSAQDFPDEDIPF